MMTLEMERKRKKKRKKDTRGNEKMKKSCRTCTYVYTCVDIYVCTCICNYVCTCVHVCV